MKKASKILTLILVFVLLAGVFSGCAMFTRNTGRYRALVAVTVGDEEITVGKILDNFNNYYNTYSSYIGQGITLDWLLQMTMQSIVTQAMKVDNYTAPDKVQNHAYTEFCHNAQYLTEEEIVYSIRYVKSLTFAALDSSVQTQLAVNRTIKDEEEEDTSRDFTEFDDLEGRSYSEYTYRKRIFNEDAEEYFEKYYGGIDSIAADAKISEYASGQSINAKVEELNGRIEKESEKITVEEYKTAQDKVVKQYQRTIQNSYNIEFEQFMINQIEDMVASIIAAKYDYEVNKVIDTTGLNDTINQLKTNLDTNRAAQTAGFALNDNFVDFIEALSDTSYIYNVPEGYNYIFVKNILIPFSAQQSAMLSNLSKDLGGDTENQKYIDLRNELATEIQAEDFFSEKDEDGKYDKIGGLFKLVKDEQGNDKLVINDTENNPLYKVFKENGVVEQGDYASKDEAVIDYMKRFNTDTAQHKAAYDYVVRVGEVPSNYTAKWVPEFVDAANEAWNEGNGMNSYALAISTYGVHIVYYSANVVAQDINFTAESILDTTKPEYKLFSAYFTQQSSRMLQESVEALQKSYIDGELIKTNANFDRFLKDNGFTFNLIDFLTPDED